MATKPTNKQFFSKFARDTGNAKALDLLASGSLDGDNFEPVNNLPSLRQEFSQWTIQFYLDKITEFDVKDRLKDIGFGREYDTYGQAITQRLTVGQIKSATPAYIGLEQGKSVDMFLINKTKNTERFFTTNFNFQAHITIQDEDLLNVAFHYSYGLADYLSELTRRLYAAYSLDFYSAKMEAISNGIKSEKYPLLDTQKLEVDFDMENPQEEDFLNFTIAVNDIHTEMKVKPVLNKYNSLKYETALDPKKHVILMRAGYENRLKALTKAKVYNPEYLNLGFEIHEIEHFGGLEPFKDEDFTTPLYPVYDEVGTQIGYSTKEEQVGKDAVEVQNDEVVWKDPHADIFAIIADKEWLFYSTDASLETNVTPHNARGKYYNVFLNAPLKHIHTDPVYTLITLSGKNGKKA